LAGFIGADSSSGTDYHAKVYVARTLVSAASRLVSTLFIWQADPRFTGGDSLEFGVAGIETSLDAAA
jgi:hypothetical protein